MTSLKAYGNLAMNSYKYASIPVQLYMNTENPFLEV